MGFNHRDLHGGNILFGTTRDGDTPNYFLIDFDEGAEGPFGFDVAYLEAERFIKTCDGVNPEQCAALLSDKDDFTQSEALPVGTSSYKQLSRRIASSEAEAQELSSRQDALRRQSFAAKIAAGLTWLRRGSLSESQRHAAHYYTAFQCGAYVVEYLPGALKGIELNSGQESSASPTTKRQAGPSFDEADAVLGSCLLYTSPSPRDQRGSRMPSSA